MDDLRSTREQPGFRMFSDEPAVQFTAGALARVRGTQLTYLHASSAEEFSAFNEPGVVKLAWSAQLAPHRVGQSRLRVELRLGATDHEAWRSVRWQFACLGPVMHWAERQVLGSLADDLGWPGMVRARPAAPAAFMPNAPPR